MNSSFSQSEQYEFTDGNTSSEINHVVEINENLDFSQNFNEAKFIDEQNDRPQKEIVSLAPIVIDIEDNFECPICCSTESKDASTNLKCCSLLICDECFKNHVETLISESKAVISCPSCSIAIDPMTILNKENIRLASRERYQQILAQDMSEREQMHVKLCPHCNFITIIDPNDPRKKANRSRRENEQWIQCEQCEQLWCWPCYAPAHPDITCNDYKKKEQLGVEVWAKRQRADRPGQRNAQRCPKCSIFIEKTDGCDHMNCTKCEAKFCYRCGSRMMLPLYIGHDAKYSVFGCKYKLYPDHPCLRWFIRWSIFLGIIFLAPIIIALVIALAAIALPFLLIFSIFFLPLYAIIKCKK